MRIKEERRFLFLPLEEKGEYPLIVNNELKLFPNKSSFAIKTVKFKPKEGATIIQASKRRTNMYSILPMEKLMSGW